jgi:hypothetical protein
MKVGDPAIAKKAQAKIHPESKFGSYFEIRDLIRN